MKLDRTKWEDIKFGDVVSNNTKSLKDPLENGVEFALGLENFEPENLTPISKIDIATEGTKFSRYFEKGQLLFGARRSYLRQMVIAPFNGVCTANIMVFDTKDEKKISRDFISLICQSNKFIDFSSGTSVGSLFPNAKWNSLKNFKLKLPSLKEQNEISDLFSTLQCQIDNSIEQNILLKSLKSKLATELVCTDPSFGNLLSKENSIKTTLGGIANEIRENNKTPLENGIERFVGLEHIEPGNLTITGFGNVADGTTFTKTFKTGDVLFGRRRAYLKKAAHADFNGLCSGDITVLRANEEIMLSDLLPFYLSSDPVFEYAISNSAGSLSPRAKWRDLSKYELELPNKDIQKKILGVFVNLQESISQNKEQLILLKKLKHSLLNKILG